MLNSLKSLSVILLASVATAQILSVQHGGTGNSTLTQHGPLVGNGTGAVTAISPGTAGQCLISGGPSVDPVFGPCPGGVGGGPGAGSCSVNQYVNALINGSAPTCSQVTYSQIGGTVPTWNQSTSGNAATATALSANGAANQVWTMTSGSAQGWATPTSAGSTSWSLLTGPTGPLSIAMGAQPSTFISNSGNGANLPVWWMQDSGTGATTAAPFFKIQTSASNTLENPLMVTSGAANGLTISGGSGNITATGTAKFVGPHQLTGVAAGPLAADASGNIVASSGGGAGGLIYSTPLLNQTVGTTSPATLSTTTMATPTANTTYRVEVDFKQTNTPACTTFPSVAVRVSYTDADTGVAIPGNQGGLVLYSGNGNNGSISYAVFTTAAPGQGNSWYSVPMTFYAQGGQPVSLVVWQQAAGASCTTLPTYTVRPYLYQVQ